MCVRACVYEIFFVILQAFWWTVDASFGKAAWARAGLVLCICYPAPPYNIHSILWRDFRK